MEINNSFAFDSEQEARKELEIQGRILRDIAIKIWRKYIASYTPKVYVRTTNAEKSIKLGIVKKLDEDTLGIELTWVDDLAYHDSIFGEGNKKGHAVMLISEGWNKSKKKTKLSMRLGKQVHRLTYFEGFDYIGKIIEEFNKGRHKGIELELQWSGKFLK